MSVYESAKQNLIVIVPAYEPPAEFVDYAKEIAGYAKRLVVVNDGSKSDFDPVFEEIARISNVDYLYYGENHGKGYALKFAFKHCIENFSSDDIIVTADCDGQHKVKDVMGVYKSVLGRSDALILGSRDFNEKNVPPRSRFGNTFTRRLYKMLYGIKLYDTQTGLRGFTVELAKSFVLVKGDRFEYELGQLIWSKKHGVRILETPIETVYPEDPVDHVSHFRTIRDSMRVMGVMLSNLGWYLCSSVLSAVVDVGVFFVLSTIIFSGGLWYEILIATVGARIISSIVNFIFNYKYVFSGAGRGALLRYYILWSCQLGASYGIASIFSKLLGLSGIALTLAKGAGDLLLALLSYQIQQYWVFGKKNKTKFWSARVRFSKAILTFFSKEYRCNCLPPKEPCVYVARHLDLRGPLTTIKWLDFDFHPMVFSVFFTKKDCYDQYANYTFTKRRGKKNKGFNLKAYIASRAVVPLVHGIEAVPVYRDRNAIKTFRQAFEYLLRGESVIVYPDIEYTAPSSKMSEIYDGFLYLGEYYKKKTGKSLPFIPLYINDEKLSVDECDPVYADSFARDKAEAKEKIKLAINGIKSSDIDDGAQSAQKPV